MLAVEVVVDSATPALRRLTANVSGRAVFAAAASAVSQLVQQHLVDKDQIPNRLGGDRTHFYAAAASGTNWEAYPGRAEVSVAKEGSAQRLLGGTIRPVNRKYLTIPVTPQAHGRAASEFGSDLRFVLFGGTAKNPNTVGILVLGEGASATVLYLLVRKVTQRADPTVLPTDERIANEAADAIAEILLPA